MTKPKISAWVPPWVYPVLLILAVLTIWVRLTIIRTTYSIGETGKEIHALQQVKEQADLKNSGLRSPRRLEVIAKTKFGLTQPRAEQIIHFKEADVHP